MKETMEELIKTKFWSESLSTLIPAIKEIFTSNNDSDKVYDLLSELPHKLDSGKDSVKLFCITGWFVSRMNPKSVSNQWIQLLESCLVDKYSYDNAKKESISALKFIGNWQKSNIIDHEYLTKWCHFLMNSQSVVPTESVSTVSYISLTTDETTINTPTLNTPTPNHMDDEKLIPQPSNFDYDSDHNYEISMDMYTLCNQLRVADDVRILAYRLYHEYIQYTASEFISTETVPYLIISCVWLSGKILSESYGAHKLKRIVPIHAKGLMRYPLMTPQQQQSSPSDIIQEKDEEGEENIHESTAIDSTPVQLPNLQLIKAGIKEIEENEEEQVDYYEEDDEEDDVLVPTITPMKNTPVVKPTCTRHRSTVTLNSETFDEITSKVIDIEMIILQAIHFRFDDVIFSPRSHMNLVKINHLRQRKSFHGSLHKAYKNMSLTDTATDMPSMLDHIIRLMYYSSSSSSSSSSSDTKNKEAESQSKEDKITSLIQSAKKKCIHPAYLSYPMCVYYTVEEVSAALIMLSSHDKKVFDDSRIRRRIHHHLLSDKTIEWNIVRHIAKQLQHQSNVYTFYKDRQVSGVNASSSEQIDTRTTSSSSAAMSTRHDDTFLSDTSTLMDISSPDRMNSTTPRKSSMATPQSSSSSRKDTPRKYSTSSKNRMDQSFTSSRHTTPRRYREDDSYNRHKRKYNEIMTPPRKDYDRYDGDYDYDRRDDDSRDRSPRYNRHRDYDTYYDDQYYRQDNDRDYRTSSNTSTRTTLYYDDDEMKEVDEDRYPSLDRYVEYPRETHTYAYDCEWRQYSSPKRVTSSTSYRQKSESDGNNKSSRRNSNHSPRGDRRRDKGKGKRLRVSKVDGDCDGNRDH